MYKQLQAKLIITIKVEKLNCLYCVFYGMRYIYKNKLSNLYFNLRTLGCHTWCRRNTLDWGGSLAAHGELFFTKQHSGVSLEVILWWTGIRRVVYFTRFNNLLSWRHYAAVLKCLDSEIYNFSLAGSSNRNMSD